MGKIINPDKTDNSSAIHDNNEVIELTNELLAEAKTTVSNNRIATVPIAALPSLGGGVASLIPVLNKVTQTTTVPTEGLYRLANAHVGDTLKIARNGNFWGAIKSSDGKSKLAQLRSADSLSATTSISAINPATMLMAVTLFSIEKGIGQIADLQNQIVSFLETEKKAEIEADVETLMSIITNYKLNWDNEHFVTSNHKLVLDIRRTARKNISVYQKMISETLKAHSFIMAQNKVTSILKDLEKEFQYYRLSLYSFSLASMMEVLLSGNFNEEFLTGIKDDIISISDDYRQLFHDASVRLEEMGSSILEASIMKSLGTAGNAVGKFVGKIPLLQKGTVDERLQDTGTTLRRNAVDMEKKAVYSFSTLGNPAVSVFVEKLEDMIQIYNHTSQIYFDNENIYLLH